VDGYRQRWHIEQTLRTLKTQGLNVESNLLEEGSPLKKLAVLAVSAAVKTMPLTLARNGQGSIPATDRFARCEHAFLRQLGQRLEGKPVKQKNPHAQPSLAGAAWTVARLGGWNGEASERPPGPITMLHGLQAWANMPQRWHLASSARNVCIR
jgi:hypothetical protein